MNGIITLVDVGSYEIENCGDSCHVLVKLNDTMLYLAEENDKQREKETEMEAEAEERELTPEARFSHKFL